MTRGRTPSPGPPVGISCFTPVWSPTNTFARRTTLTSNTWSESSQTRDIGVNVMKPSKTRPCMAALMAVFVGMAIAVWLGGQSANAAKAVSAAPPASIPTFSTADLSRTGIFCAGGKYVGAPGKEVMGGSAYVEVWVPKQIRHPYPIVYIHGAGQTATDWQQTPDGRPGWAYYFAKQGYVQYMVDSPARGRSPYVPDHDGNLTIRTAPNLEAIFTASAKKGDFPRAHLQTQFPGTGLMGDTIFDDFAKDRKSTRLNSSHMS